MAMIKCRECKQEVSSKADSCPNCGAKVPKSTSLFTWIVLAGIVYLVYAAISSPPEISIPPSSTSSNSSAPTPAPVPPKLPEWSVIPPKKDEMTGEISTFATSPRVTPSPKMPFPYQGVESFIGVGCDDTGSRWAYFGFESAPHIADDETEDGYNVITAAIKFDDGGVTAIRLKQPWNSRFLHVFRADDFIEQIKSSNQLRLRLTWSGQQPVDFVYTLRGSTKTIAQITDSCSATK